MVAAAIAGALAGCAGSRPLDESVMQRFTVTPIGTVVHRDGKDIQLRLDPRYAPGLLGLDEWSHVDVVYWLHANDDPDRRAILQVHPRGDRANPLTGVFACRAPVRPNPIAITTCRILAVQDATVTVDHIDAFDGSPIIDLKPHIPGPRPEDGDVRVPEWVGDPRGRRHEADPERPH